MDYVLEPMSEEDELIAQDFETGWSEERIREACKSTGPAAWLYELIIKDNPRFFEVVEQENITPEGLISKAVEEYLAKSAA